MFMVNVTRMRILKCPLQMMYNFPVRVFRRQLSDFEKTMCKWGIIWRCR